MFHFLYHFIFIIFTTSIISPAFAEEKLLDGSQLNLLYTLPFLGILLSLALFPIIAPHFWHKHYGKVSAFWAVTIILPMLFFLGIEITLQELFSTYFLEYIPFILLAGSLFVITGGIKLSINVHGTPINNTIIISIGTIIASFIGTTGAAMLFIRPLIKINEERQHKTHIIIFFIFLVCNIGGSLTALGDPPLFLGFLKGVDFFWPTTHLFKPFIFITIPLIILFFIVDSYHFKKENNSIFLTKNKFNLTAEGIFNFLILIGVMLSVIISGIWTPNIHFSFFQVHLELQDIIRDISLIALAFASWKLTNPDTHLKNNFTWEPLIEVTKLFAGIFITAAPVIAILESGTKGSLSYFVNLVSTNNNPINYMYFWLTGILSGFLDNAPTYLVFFHLAGGEASILMKELASTLTAISTGAVFMGALTYIGNAPNFMSKAIAETHYIKMPTFFGYIGYSAIFLLPIFILMSFIFF